MHVPFCEMRCGFCNLFTQPRPRGDLADRYLDALEREAEAARPALRGARFARLAIGGGTPTYLTESQLSRLLALVRHLGGDPARIPASVETSPATATPEPPRFAQIRRRDAGQHRRPEFPRNRDNRRGTTTARHRSRERTRCHTCRELCDDERRSDLRTAGTNAPTWLDSVCRAARVRARRSCTCIRSMSVR